MMCLFFSFSFLSNSGSLPRARLFIRSNATVPARLPSNSVQIADDGLTSNS